MKKIIVSTIVTTLYILALPIQGEFATSIEKWSLPENEDLTISKVGLSFNITPYWFAGFDIYGAVDGKRGGFFTFGFEGGLQTNPNNLFQLRSGVFIGAGGGGRAPQGGGLMLREYIEGRLNLKNISIGTGLSHTNFPNGDIKSTQLFSSLYIPFEIEKDKQNNIYLKNSEIKNKIYIKGGKYFTSENSRTTKNKKLEDLTIIGIEALAYINNNSFISFSLNGANGENADGYMELFTGIGVEYQIYNLPLYSSLMIQLGMGGGGEVDTAGGSMYKIKSSLESNFYKNLKIGIEAGYIKSFNGTFKAKYLGAYIGFKSIFGDKTSDIDKYSIRALTKLHFTTEKDFKEGKNRDEKLYLEGMAIDKFINNSLYITGQSLWAFKGKSGGYTEGLLGCGYIYSLNNNLSIRTEILIGAAGGGGVETGGLIGVINSSLDYNLNKDIYLSIGAGYTKAKKGLSSKDLSLSLGYKFGLHTK